MCIYAPDMNVDFESFSFFIQKRMNVQQHIEMEVCAWKFNWIIGMCFFWTKEPCNEIIRSAKADISDFRDEADGADRRVCPVLKALHSVPNNASDSLLGF